jgi:hypothetical protein
MIDMVLSIILMPRAEGRQWEWSASGIPVGFPQVVGNGFAANSVLCQRYIPLPGK